MLPDLAATVESLQQFVDTLPLTLQFLALLVIGAIPFLEGDVAGLVGIVAGVPALAAFLPAAGGTVLATFASVTLGASIGGRRSKGERERRILARVEKWGIPVAMFLGGFFLSVVINGFVMSAAGLNRFLVLISGIGTAVVNTAFVMLVASGALHVLT